ncbi:MAG TPA: hypothetical protein PLD20_03140 [Blastocatellia bacterium]|nr:hypothetical protein [Blastocatellia bacterium]HMV84930.1 hypothetical protein [Blastocatellia bacterium]HMZ16899.1 hypothetical protein [Blastocatellia bacterium]HNG32107.1 hypothetical protein [Blastocatellia bacterium]
MKRKVSEFAYGFVLTHELVRGYGYLPTDAPLPGTEKKRRKAKAESEAEALPKGYPLFLQFKASEFMKRKNAGESKLVGLPYFRFPIYRKSQSNQQALLAELEKRGYPVFYATPKMHEAVNLNGAFFDERVVAHSVFVSPLEIGELPDNQNHRVVFSGATKDVYFCSKPRKLERAIHGEDFAERIEALLAGKEPEVLDDDFFRVLAEDMVSLVSPNRRIFDELSRGKFEMTAAMFANYLARTLFDCELLIIPAKTETE